MIKFNLKIAWRNILKNKVFSGVNIIGLALSMAACLAISMFIWNETHYDDFHKNKDNIYRLTEKQNQAGTMYTVAVTPGPLAPALKKDFPEIVNTIRFGSWSGMVKNGTHTFEEGNMLLTENSVFNSFSFSLVKGNPATALLSPDEIVITENTAVKYFGSDWKNNPAIIGQIFRLNNQIDFKLAGVVKNPPVNSSIRFDMLLPIEYLFKEDKWSYQWNSNNYHTYLQLKPGTDITAFAKKIEKQLHRYNSETNDLLQLQPLAAQYLYSAFDFYTDWGNRSNIKYVKIFSGVGLLLLIIACVNFVNLSTARSLKRSREVGVRKVNGASRKQLITQFLSESVLVTMLAGIAAVLMLKLLHPFLETIIGAPLHIDFSAPLFLSFLLLFIVIIGLVAGIYPAFILSAFKPVKVLKSAGGEKSGKYFQQGLVVFQFAISVTLMVATFFMYRQLRFMQNKDLGFDKEHLISVRLGGNLKQQSHLLKNDLDAEPSIAATAPATMQLVNVGNSSYVEWEGMQTDDKFLITQANVDPDFIPVLGMQLMNGNNFSKQRSTDTTSYIVNESAAKRMGYTVNTAPGKKISFWGAKGTIIGVVKDFHFKTLVTGIEPFILRYQPKENYYNLFVKTLPGKAAEAIKKIQLAYKKYEQETPVEFSFVNEAINKTYQDEQRTATIILLFACLTIFVGCLGLFGLTVFAAEQRLKEIGIRKVLGAGIKSIAALLSKDFLKLVMIATVIAIPIAWYVVGKWLQGYAYRIDIDWWVFALVAVAVCGIALATISLHAIKAAMANPVKSLRTE